MCYRLDQMDIVSEHPLSDLELFKRHHRLRVFYFFGTTCVCCGVNGSKLVQLKRKDNGDVTWDVYTHNMRLMTVDHIIPKSRGGRSTLENLQPMCTVCNRKKDNLDITLDELRTIVNERVRDLAIPARLMALRAAKTGV